jgi:hypothetical protein
MYKNVFFSVGKKLISLLACSILKVYNGVDDVWLLAVTAVTAQNPTAPQITKISINCFLFIFTTSFEFAFLMHN